jgi:hypothetical protein
MAGQGLTRTTMRVPLSALAQCSITYTPVDERYNVLVHVREHPLIILQQDRVFNVSCNREVCSSALKPLHELCDTESRIGGDGCGITSDRQ